MKTLKEYIVTENNFFKNLGVGMIPQIEKWLQENYIKNYTINDDLTIDVNGIVDLEDYKEKQLPEYIQFGKVTKHFYINFCKNLKSLKGCPQEVGGYFFCNFCPKLESLEDSPMKVGGGISCTDCKSLKSLKGCPQEVGGDFHCRFCGQKFTKDDVEKYCKVKGKIHV
jgi:hypothetical protein